VKRSPCCLGDRREFTHELIQAVAPSPSPRWNVNGSIVQAVALSGRHPTLGNLLFKHALIQETAYRSLLNSKRQQYHLQIAQVLERASLTLFLLNGSPGPSYAESRAERPAIGYWQKAGMRASNARPMRKPFNICPWPHPV